VGEPPRWAIDTNVIVSGLLSPAGPPGRLVDMILAAELQLVFDDRIEAEYCEVLGRSHLRIAASQRHAWLAILPFQCRVTALPWRHPAPPDPDDVMFLEVALQATDQVLVTGNQRHYPAGCCGPVKVLTPAQAWTRLAR